MIKKLLLLIAFVGIISPIYAQQSIRLNTGWEYIRQDLGGIWEAVRPVRDGQPESVPLWQKVTLPHCFNDRDAVDPDVNYYQGPGWYRTQLNINNPYANGRTLLHFEGAGQRTDVYVYTTKVASHLGGYDEWTADLTDAIEAFKHTEVYQKQFKGRIPVSIRCDNSRDLETIPSRMSDFNVYGGIYRYLNLVYQPSVSIDRLMITPVLDSTLTKGTLEVKTILAQHTQGNVTGQIKVIDANGKMVANKNYKVDAPATDGQTTRFKISKPHAWQPADPYLYTVQVTATADGQTFTSTQKVGFRNFEFKEKGPFLLNGKRLLLRGTHRHEDHAGVGAAMTEAMMRQEMQLIKDMGANFIRLGHYQQSRIVLDLCDSLGILVWEEEPWCRGGLGGEAYQAMARQMMTNMIQQHYNHPSIILWGLGNENDWEGDFAEFDKQKIRKFMKQQHDLTHRLDATRLTSIRRCDFCADIPDVYSPSIWAGWYKAKYTDYKQLTQDEVGKVKRFFHAEWGGDSHARRFAEDPLGYLEAKRTTDPTTGKKRDVQVARDGDWSESYIAELFDWHLKEQESMPWLTGSAFWTFKDFSTPLRADNPIPYVNQKGVVERDMSLKESYYIFQSYWSAKPMVHIFGHNWPVRWGKPGELKQVKVFSNADEAELYVNGKSYGVKKRNVQDFPAAGLHWDVPFNTGNNLIRVVAQKGKVTLTDQIEQQYETRQWAAPATMTAKVISTDQDVATIEVQLTDAKGVPCLDAANWISFGLAGDGDLLADLGTSTGSRKLQAYNGRAMVKVKLQQGHSVLSVGSPRLPTIFITLGGK
ncbi:DUF4982 domain-containing protein [Mucilaginibacter daejeonensis]|uniref:glycoside hydrolase family 2 protein n=1 Tax=Mucilaginibacter daejeonensis TaxID=398049 RepID=UPI001D179C71|nr:glycoside hydrolase family 2 TIM barrel-domain containing protein [Mucilaginibacter daejeonensis]UEG54654.1 DUF4982 domain-containing protein [Mucilaginibacter daejeonensis]